MTNPYEPTSASKPTPSAPHWIRRFVVLNAILFAIPVSILLFSLVWTQIELAIEHAGNGGDPVTYQHYYWISAPSPPWPIIAYFIVPNAIMLSLYVRFLSSRNRNASED